MVEQPQADALVTAFKRRGHFDELRKELLSSFQDGKHNEALLSELKRIVDREVSKDPGLLARDRTKAATLLGGAVDRSNVYSNAQKDMDEEFFRTSDFRLKVERIVAEIVSSESQREGADHALQNSRSENVQKE